MADEVQPAPEVAEASAVPVEPARKIALVGEIPFAGLALAKALLQNGMSVRALCPDDKSQSAIQALQSAVADSNRAVEVVRGDFDIPGALDSVLKGAYAVVFVSPISMNGRMHRAETHLDDVRKLIEAAQNSTIRKIVYHSGIGAHPESQSHALRNAAIGEEIIHASKCEDFRIRTGPLMGCGDDFLSEIIQGAKVRSPFMKIYGYGSTTVQPLHVDDFARCVARLLSGKQDEFSPGYYYLAGPETTTLLDLIDAAAEKTGNVKLKFHVPLFVLQFMAGMRNADFRERVSLLFDSFATEQNDAPRLLKPGEALATPRQAQDEILKVA